jgi:hypothetical protein
MGLIAARFVRVKKSFSLDKVLKYNVLGLKLLKKSVKICTNCAEKVHKLCSRAE